MEGDQVTHATIIFPLVLSLGLFYLVRRGRRQPNLRHIPAVGPSSFLFSYFGAFAFLWNPTKLLQRGYRQYGTSAFRVAQFTRWIVIITGPQLLEEMRRAPEDDLSCNGVTLELRNEVVVAFLDVISKDLTSKRASAPTANLMTEIVSRVYNRGIVGLQGCKSTPLININKQFLLANVTTTPAPFGLIRFIILYLFGGIRGNVNKIHHFLLPIIEDRRREAQSLRKEDPHDLLNLMASVSEAPREIVHSIVALNYQAVVPMALTLTHALRHLAMASPHNVVEPMREEVEAITRKYGLTLKSLEYMRKLDSFLKESMRLNDLSALPTCRKTRTPYTFSDGTFIPAGTLLSLASTPTHANPTRYVSPGTFEAFRFVHGNGPRYEIATTTTDFLAWGYGRTACPGRFVAAAIMKLIFAHILLRYDVKPKGNISERPKEKWIGVEKLPDMKAEVVFDTR